MVTHEQSGNPLSKHRIEQEQRWYDLQQKLVELKKTEHLSITYSEVASGLSLSRQRLFNFLKNHSVGLPIARHNIFELWDRLTLPSEKDSKISLKARSQRGQFREQCSHVLDELLEASGFLPTTKELTPRIIPIERITSRLLGPWIRNETILCDLADNIIDTILDKGSFEPNSLAAEKRKGLTLKESKELPAKFFDQANFSKIEKRFNQELDRFASLGKVHFYHDELYELYQSIFENYTYKSFPSDMKAVECEFRTLSFSLVDKSGDSEFEDDILSKSTACEEKLRLVSGAEKRLVFPPVIEVKARFSIGDQLGLQEVIFSYSCCSTHFEAAMTSLSHGLGYVLSSALSVTGFVIRSIAKRSDSLARVSITLTEENSIVNESHRGNYQGIWVDQNVILGTLNSTAYAVLSWLAQRLTLNDFERFYSICYQNSVIKESLYRNIEDIYDYRSIVREEGTKTDDFHNVEKKDDEALTPNSLETLSETDIVQLAAEIDDFYKKVEKINSSVDRLEHDSSIDAYFKNYRDRLDQKAFLAQLAIAREALFNCDLVKAKGVLEELENKIYIGKFRRTSRDVLAPITILYQSERMLYRLLVGDERFWCSTELSGSGLLQGLEDVTKELREYAISQNAGILDFDIYLAAGQYCGVVGLSKFYFCSEKDRLDLENAYTYMINAAHYSAKLGHRQRVFRCLCYASRMCCRLNKPEIARKLIELVENLFRKQRGDVFNSFNAQDFLAKGEYSLLFPGKENIEEDMNEALMFFLNAWRKASMHKFDRALIGSVYNITRVLDILDSLSSSPSISSLLKGMEGHLQKQRTGTGSQSYRSDYAGLERDGKILSKILKEIIVSYSKYEESDLSKNLSLGELSLALKEHIVNRLDGWRESVGESPCQHPFSEKIRNGTFLSKL